MMLMLRSGDFGGGVSATQFLLICLALYFVMLQCMFCFPQNPLPCTSIAGTCCWQN